MAELCSLFVHGQPVPQGSMRAFAHKHTGKVVVRHQQSEQLEAWRTLLAGSMRQVWGTKPATKQWLRVDLAFVFERPESHLYGKRSTIKRVKEGAALYPHQDIDKLVRAVYDAGTGIIWEDDKYICGGTNRKAYSVGGGGVRITVSEEY